MATDRGPELEAHRLAGAAIVAVWTVARVYVSQRAGSRTVVSSAMTGRRRALLWISSVSLAPIYLFYFSGYLDAFTVPVPAWVAWSGNALLAAAVALFAWCHTALGRNWTANVDLSAGQTLVATGPYRWVRHPMYSSLLLLALALVPATANPVAALPYLVSMVAVYLERVDDEERMMLESFGDSYAQYMKRTGRLVPRFGSGVDA